MEREYAQALARLSSLPNADEAKLVAQLVAHLKASGRMKLLPRIARELAMLKARTKTVADRLEVASEGERAEALKEAKLEDIDPSDVIINPSLIRGWRAMAGGRLTDRSSKQALFDIYKKITT